MPNCRDNSKYRTSYTLVIAAFYILVVVLSSDPITYRNVINMKAKDSQYKLVAQIPKRGEDITRIEIHSKLGLIKPKTAHLFTAFTNMIANPDASRQEGATCMYIGNKDELLDARGVVREGSNGVPGLLTSYSVVGKSFYKTTDHVAVTCIEETTLARLSEERWYGWLAISIATILFCAAVVVVWLFCTGWCECASPWMSARVGSLGEIEL